MSLSLAFSLVFFVLVAMADFPPNLEDGEKWLPSDIYEEIVSNNVSAEALVDNIGKDCATHVLDEPIKSAFEISPNGFLGANGVPVACNPLAFQAVSGSFSLYNPIAPIQSKVESFDNGGTRVSEQQNHFWPVHVNGDQEVKGFVGFTGTGVFFPRITNAVKEPEPVRGTGFFLQPSVADVSTATRKKKKSGKNGQGSEKIAAKKDTQGKKEGT